MAVSAEWSIATTRPSSLRVSTAPLYTAMANSATVTERPRSPADSCGQLRAKRNTAIRPHPSDMARTQQQRREETIGRLLDASIATIVEVGYARASAAVITKRAQVSHVALV